MRHYQTDDEWIVFYAMSGDTILTKGWKMTSRWGIVAFPDTLPGSLAIYSHAISGKFYEPAASFNLPEDQFLWTFSRDTVKLVNEQGILVDSFIFRTY